MKTNLRRAILALMGFSAAPMLTACYAMPYDETFYEPFDGISGEIVDSSTRQSIEGIKVSVSHNGKDQVAYTDGNGRFALEGCFDHSVQIIAEDIDGAKNGEYLSVVHRVSNIDNDNCSISLPPSSQAE